MQTNETKSTTGASSLNLAALLGEGVITEMARSAGVSVPNVSKALKRGRPGNRFVIEAMQRAKASGALDAAREINALSA